MRARIRRYAHGGYESISRETPKLFRRARFGAIVLAAVRINPFLVPTESVLMPGDRDFARVALSRESALEFPNLRTIRRV